MRIVCAGDNVVDRYTAARRLFPGGNAVNVAVKARRAGAQSAYVGAVGTDGPGDVIMAALAAEGVMTDRVRRVDGPTAYTDVEIVDADRVFARSDEGVSRFVLDEDDLGYLAGFDVIYTGECSMLEGQVPAMAACGPVAFDFSDRPPDYVMPLLPHVSVACVSASHLGAAAAESLARSMVESGPTYVLATRGAAGAILLERDGAVHSCKAVPVELVDTLGAGDAFIARVLVGLFGDETPDQALAAAARCAAETCKSAGAFGHGIPYAPALMRTALSHQER